MTENFAEKYTDTNPISKLLIARYFACVGRLTNAISGRISSALEVGCGEGFSTARIREILPEDVEFEASEYLERQISFARIRNPDIKIIQEDVYELQKHDKSFDLVFLLEVLEHLEFPELALKELARITKKYLILGVPSEPLWRILNCTRFKYLRDLGNTPGHVNNWSKRKIIGFVEEKFGPVLEVRCPIPWTLILASPRDFHP